MCAAVLGLEAIVIGLSVPVMITTSGVDQGVALAAGLGLAALAMGTAALLRHRIAYALGWLVQVGAIALGFVTAAMFIVGVMFGALWTMAIVFGGRVEQLKAQRADGVE